MRKLHAALLPLLLLLFTCEEPVDTVIEAVDEANTILRKYEWKLAKFKIEVANDDIPPPILFNSTDSLIKKGIYDLDDMVLDASEMRTYKVNFTHDGKVLTKDGQLDLIGGDKDVKYFVFNDKNVRISAAEKLIYDYLYDGNNNEIILTANQGSIARLVNKVNQDLIDKVANKSPEKIGDLMAHLLFNNEKLQSLINNVIVDAISGKLEFINEFDEETAAKFLASEIYKVLSQIDWESALTQLLKEQLEKLTNIDPDKVSEDISAVIVAFINENITADTIYEVIFPYIESIPTNAEKVSETISTLIVNLFFEVFAPNVLQPVLTDAWRDFTKLDEEKITTVSDTLAYYVSDIWINQENVSNLILPFTQKIDETSILKMGELATEATNAIEGIVNVINDSFSDINLQPDYESMQSTIKAAFIAAKPVIGLVGGPEKAADEVAGLIISQFLNQNNISSAFQLGITYLQSIDPEIAGSTIAEWLLSLEPEIGPEIISYLTDFLSPILENINPELTSLAIANALNDFISENITPEKVKSLLLPILEAFANLNAEAVANFFAKVILDLDIIKDTITEENIKNVLLPVLQKIKETDIEQLVQNLIDAVVNSGIFEDTITEERVATIISLLIYKSAWDNVQIANNFKEATIVLRHD
ncbi:hypothetical protein KFZ70_03120 [Tamlana fucoidanivorans]|uniref:Uncharacterized protein n=1 Tax=Allotamlana fucoidanivorans TaxID=2583814 RepID=A0A5C4SL48_9FLAO|nr:hypothetical protein [Tamlana fucoidanivorans]TNJ44311.1 hypothetical protein FGF67_09800 [Tamlana fucoidanivorans]